MNALSFPLGFALIFAAGAVMAVAAHAGVVDSAGGRCGGCSLSQIFSVNSSSTDSARWQPVDDATLASQTGKYAGSAMIDGMVLNVLSQWRLPNGASASAQGSLVVDDANRALDARVSTAARVSDSAHGNGNGNGAGIGAGASPGSSARGGQNVAISGVSQLTQVAGDNNVGINSAVIDFNGAQAQPLAGNNAPSASAANAAGTIKSGIAFGSGGVTLALRTPAGAATQTIAPGTAHESGTIAQFVRIVGNAQAVSNQLQLSLRTQPMPAALVRQLGMLEALRNTAYMRR
ncbi:peptidase C39 [Trinickia symbiotica]|uniref:Peptidase C39 n=1 Tax=Trinickia symbiotica TaxID=863227 RepID=A0A2T3XPD0_9BURK|nr:peptidase C39 [Trinickia symbiotica]PTB18370.1 peptidase C39 [Trinickia symbiotica]